MRSSAGERLESSASGQVRRARSRVPTRADLRGGPVVDAEHRVPAGDGAQLLVGGVGADAVEEHADLHLPAPQVGAQDVGLVGVGDLGGAERLDPAADPQLAASRRPAGCGPTGCRPGARRGSAAPSWSSRLTGVVRHSPLVRPRTRSSREPHTLMPSRVSAHDDAVEDVPGEPAGLEVAGGGAGCRMLRLMATLLVDIREHCSRSVTQRAPCPATCQEHCSRFLSLLSNSGQNGRHDHHVPASAVPHRPRPGPASSSPRRSRRWPAAISPSTARPALSLRAVAREVGMVSSAVYRYFPSRDDLLTALIIDAYDAVGRARRGRRARDRASRGVAARWLDVCEAVRAWALANAHEYALIYGSPVPGYAAPEATIGPASRVPLVLLRLARRRVSRAARSRPGESPPMPRAVRSDLRATPRTAAPGVPDAVLSRGLRVWAQLLGTINLEMFGHLHNVIHDYDAFFTLQMRQRVRVPRREMSDSNRVPLRAPSSRGARTYDRGSLPCPCGPCRRNPGRRRCRRGRSSCESDSRHARCRTSCRGCRDGRAASRVDRR